ncbi:hypothetical protein Tco_1564987 [Tanacetum coccineum]
MNYQPVRSENQANKHVGPKEDNHNLGSEDNIDAGDSEIEVESAQDYFLERLKRQEHDANDAAEDLRKEFAQVSTASPYGGLSFTNLTNTDQDDSEIPALEEIYDNPTAGIFTNASYDDEGAVADFTILLLILDLNNLSLNNNLRGLNRLLMSATHPNGDVNPK